MARVLTKKSTVAAKVPLATDLEIGELAVNTADAKLYTKHSDNTVKQLGIATNDSRLTDAREWTASTVTQAEAEAGTATTRRAWTAQRVFQAIAAWWAASAMKTKLDGIATGATANATDAQLRDRTTHTGTQAISTVTGLQTALDGKINTSERGVSGGVATLDQFAMIPASQLPSYVDDVLEFQSLANFPAVGEGGKIYIAINQGTAANPTRQYRWTGSAYAEINPSPGTTDALTEGSTNLYFSESRVRNAVLTGLSFASSAAVAATDSVLSAFGKIQAQLGLKAPLASPALTGNPTAPTQAADDNDTSIATTAHVKAAMALFGVGNTPVIGANTAYLPTGMYRDATDAFGSGAQAMYLNINYSQDGTTNDRKFQFAAPISTTENYYVRSSLSPGVFTPVRTLWHTGNLVKQTRPTDTTAGALMAVGAFGLGGRNNTTTASLDALESGFHVLQRRVSGGNTPSVFTDGDYGIVLKNNYLIGPAGTLSSALAYGTSSQRLWWLTSLGTSLEDLKLEIYTSRSILGTGSIVQEALDAKKNISAVITKAATAQTSLITDAGQYQRFTNTGASTYTIAPQSSVAWADNTELTIRRAAAANLTLVAGSGVTLNAPSGGTLVLTNNMTVTLKRVAANVWDVIGQTVAA